MNLVELPKKARQFRRWIWAFVISFGFHLGWLVLTRPTLLDVVDTAVSLELVDHFPGRPASSPSATSSPASAVPPKDDGTGKLAKVSPVPKGPSTANGAARIATALSRKKSVPVVDGGVVPGADGIAVSMSGDGGVAKRGVSVCYHDLFEFLQQRPSWLLWLSLATLRGTAYHDGLTRTLGSFGIGRSAMDAAFEDPVAEIDSLLAVARDVVDIRAFGMVAYHRVDEQKLKNRLALHYRNLNQAVTWSAHPDGWTGQTATGSAWHLGGSGRVVAFHESRYDLNSVTPQGRRTTSIPWRWPGHTRCIAQNMEKKKYDGNISNIKRLLTGDVAQRGRAALAPDGAGRWPVAVIVTSDARAIGQPTLGSIMDVAVIRVFLSEPIVLEASVRLKASVARVRSLAQSWRTMATAARSDPLLALAGMGRLFDKLHIAQQEQTIQLRLPLAQNQVKAVMLFLQLQGRASHRRHRGT